MNIPTSTIQQTDASTTHNETSFSIGIEIAKMAEECDHVFENRFKESVLMKIKSDLKGRFFKHNAAKFLDETFGEALNDDLFLRWLAKNLDYKTYRLKALLKSYKQQQTRHAFSDDKQQIYDYWLNEKISIPTTDCISGRDEIKIGKLQYWREYKHLPNIQDDNIVFKKSDKSKTYVTAHRRIYTKPIRQLFKEFTESSDMRCSF